MLICLSVMVASLAGSVFGRVDEVEDLDLSDGRSGRLAIWRAILEKSREYMVAASGGLRVVQKPDTWRWMSNGVMASEQGGWFSLELARESEDGGDGHTWIWPVSVQDLGARLERVVLSSILGRTLDRPPWEQEQSVLGNERACVGENNAEGAPRSARAHQSSSPSLPSSIRLGTYLSSFLILAILLRLP